MLLSNFNVSSNKCKSVDGFYLNLSLTKSIKTYLLNNPEYKNKINCWINIVRLLCTAGWFPINYVGVTSSQT